MGIRIWVRFGMVFIFGSFSFLSYAEGGEWTIVGPRALGMGGANVAVANDATASYWNPAAFGFFGGTTGGDYEKRGWSTQVGVGIGAQIHENLGQELDRISEFDFDALDNGQIPAESVSDFLQLVNALNSFDANENRAAIIQANGGLRIQIGHFGIGGALFAEISARGDLDLQNIFPVGAGGALTIDDFTNPENFGCSSPCAGGAGLDANQEAEIRAHVTALGWNSTQADNFIVAVDNGLSQPGVTPPPDVVAQIKDVASLANASATAQGGGGFSDNESRLVFKGIAIGEIPITYGRAVTDDFAIGGNIKYMKGRVYNSEVRIFDTDFGDALELARDDYMDSNTFGLDLGFLYRFGNDLRVGLVGRNLNTPTFDMKKRFPSDQSEFKEKPQIRAGFAYKPLNFITLAADIDVTKNETTAGELESRNLGGGIEVDLFRIIQLRGGAYKNLAEKSIGLVYTAGLGINLWLLNLDVGAAMASESSQLDGDDIPKEAKVDLALSMLF